MKTIACLTLFVAIAASSLAMPQRAYAASVGTNAAPLPATTNSEPTFWGKTNGALQLSLTVRPQNVKIRESFSLQMRVRNYSNTNLVFDAGLPSVNESQIVVVCPDGRKIVHNIWVDMWLRLNVPPGESRLGDFASEHWLDVLEYNPAKEGNTKYDTKQLHGIHRITWKLKGAVSNTVEVQVE